MGIHFHVSPGGNDDATGLSPQTAFASLPRAQQAVREALRDASPTGPVTVELAGGRYELDQPLTFTPEDSGTLQRPVRWVAADGQTPVLCGGRIINGWTVDERGWWRTRLPEVAAGDWRFAQLFVEGRRCYRPRLPKAGWFRIEEELDPTPDEETHRGANRFRFAEGQFDASWQNLQDVEVHVAQFWTSARLPIREIDADQRIITLNGYTRHLGHRRRLATGMPFLIENIFEALGEPGTFYLDRRTGDLVYVSRKGEDPQHTTAIAPRLRRLLVLRGDTDARRFVEHLTFRGIVFQHTTCLLRDEGLAAPQAEIVVPGAIGAIGIRNCRFDRCRVERVGGYGIELGLGCRENTIEGCTVRDLGGGGIKLGLAVLSDDQLLTYGESKAYPKAADGEADLMPSHNTVRNCLVQGGGRCHMTAVGVWIGNTPDNTVEHNRIADFYYSGINVGWLWEYHEGDPAQRNDVGWNHIHDIGQGVLSDMGGIYTLSICPGTVLHHNLIHDVYGRGYGGWGLYFDQATTGILARDNVVHRTKDGSFNQHWGKRNTVRNNILVDSLLFQIRTNHVTHQFASFVFEQNIVMWTHGSLLGLPGRWTSQHGADFERNLYWRTDGGTFDFDGRSLEEWQRHGLDFGSVIADPGFADPSVHDYRLGPDSPAAQIGFDWRATNLTIERAGRLGEARDQPLDPLPPAWPVEPRPDGPIRLEDMEM